MNHCRQSPDERQLFGDAVSTKLFNPPKIKRRLRKNFLQVFPQLSDVKSRNFWFGTLGIAVSRMRHFGMLQDRVLFAHGYSGLGAALAGKSDAMAERKIWSTVRNSTLWRGSSPCASTRSPESACRQSTHGQETQDPFPCKEPISNRTNFRATKGGASGRRSQCGNPGAGMPSPP